MAVRSVPEVDYSKSTMAFPMDKEPAAIFVDADIDYSKSTGAYPMYDERNQPERVVEHVGSDEADAQFPTPGPASNGDPDHYAAQRADLGLSKDPSGESDAGYEARAISTPDEGVGVPEAKVVRAEKSATPKSNRRASTK